MGKISQGILGGFSGKVGNVVGSSWKGISYIRIMPASVANPRTPGQVTQRTKFTAVQEFLQAQKALIAKGFKFLANKQTPMNAAMSYNLRNAVTGVSPDVELDYANALISRGKLLPASGAGVSVNPGLATVTWTDNGSQGNARIDDVALLTAYSPANKEAVVISSGITRGDGEAAISIPSHFVGDDLEFYLAFEAADGTSVSDSVHVGTATAA